MKKIALSLMVVLFLSACETKKVASDGSNDTPSNFMESALAVVGEIATAVESTNYPAPSGACKFSAARGVCASTTDTLAWGNCSTGTANLTGGWTEVWSSGICGGSPSEPVLPFTGSSALSLMRTTSSEIYTYSVATLSAAQGSTIATNTTTHTTYNNIEINGGLAVNYAAGSGAETITITGMHRILTSSVGTKIFDHSILSTGGNPLSLSGARASGSRVVSSTVGSSTNTLTLYHNLTGYIATLTFNDVTWGNSGCCYPTSGSITASLTGAITGTETLSFTDLACGTAAFHDTSSNPPSFVTLTQCQ